MNKQVFVYADDVQEALTLRCGTLVFIRGKASSCLNQAFSILDVGEWIKGLKVKHPKHPVIEDLKRLITLMKRNKLDLVLW